MNKIPPTNFCQTLAVNVNNSRLTDAAFRELVRNTLPIVDFEQSNSVGQLLSNDDPDCGMDVMECPHKGRYIR